MIDFGKIYCNLHPHELITNFCSKDQCLIGLCANCVCTHTQQHIQKGTAPEYENIRATYKKVQQSIRAQVELFEKDKARIDKINEKVVEKRRRAKQILEIAKEEVSILLGAYFDEKQRNMIRQIQSQQKKYGLHCQNRLQSLNSYISRQVSNLVSAAQQISSSNFLQSLPRVRTQCLVNSAKLHEEVQMQILQNQKFSTTISCDKGLLKTLVDILEKAITVALNNQSQLQKIKFQQQRLSRPKSQGKYINTYQPNTSLGSFGAREKNSQSQLKIQGGYIHQGNQIHNLRPVGQVRRSSYLNDVQNISVEPKTHDPLIQKVSVGPNLNQHLATIIPSYSFNNLVYNSNNNSNSNGFGHQPQPFINIPLGPQSPNNFVGEKMIGTNRQVQGNSFRNFQKPVTNYQIANSIISEMGKSQQKNQISGLNKKSKKSGLRILTGTETENNFAQNSQNENQRPWKPTGVYN